jgi:hypothetical protein
MSEKLDEAALPSMTIETAGLAFDALFACHYW